LIDDAQCEQSATQKTDRQSWPAFGQSQERENGDQRRHRLHGYHRTRRHQTLVLERAEHGHRGDVGAVGSGEPEQQWCGGDGCEDGGGTGQQVRGAQEPHAERRRAGMTPEQVVVGQDAECECRMPGPPGGQCHTDEQQADSGGERSARPDLSGRYRALGPLPCVDGAIRMVVERHPRGIDGHAGGGGTRHFGRPRQAGDAGAGDDVSCR